MEISAAKWALLGCLLLGAGSAGCARYGALSPYQRISVLDFAVAPHKHGRVSPYSLAMLKKASVRWLRTNSTFAEVTEGHWGGMDTVFVQGTIHAYRPHRRGTTVLRAFTPVDIRGESAIDYRFFDATGRTLLVKRIHARYMRSPAAVDPTAEAAGHHLARVVTRHRGWRYGFGRYGAGPRVTVRVNGRRIR